jgi:hypothetical protein
VAIVVDDVFLGMELAVARVAEELRRANGSGLSPLRDVAYDSRADVLWRWVDAPQDAAVWTFVRAYTGTADRARVRASLTADDFATLMTFTRRCVLAALRNEDPGAAEAAFDALSAIDLARVDWRDVLTVASLASYAARRVGLEAHEVLVRAVRWAEPRMAQILEHAVTSEIDLTGDSGYRELWTAAGPVLVEGAGEPSADDLLVRALGVAEVVETDGAYEVTDVAAVPEVPSVWLDGAVDRPRRCVKVHAEPPGVRFRDFLLVFLADAVDERHAEAVAAAVPRDAGDGTVRLGVAVGARCAVVLASSAVVGEPCMEDAQSLFRFRAPVMRLLT